MKKLYFAVCLLIFLNNLHAVELKNVDIKNINLSKGGWQLANEWDGYMGVSLKFNDDNTFQYWFYSDMKSSDEPLYPVKGKWKLVDDFVLLDSVISLYSVRYYAVQLNDEICLMPGYNFNLWISDKDKKVDYSRLHFQNYEFDIAKPYQGRKSYREIGNIEVEKVK